MLGKSIDNLISVISPTWAASRAYARQQYAQINASSSDHESMRKMLGRSGAGGYEAGKSDRLKGRTVGSPHENDIPRQQIHTLRWRSWNLHRNCGQARKIVRTLGSKVIGRGLSPQPQATRADGTAHVEFRKRAIEVWAQFTKEADFRGKPGQGGQHFVQICKTALKAVSLSGGCLYRFRHLSPAEQKKRGLSLPLQIQLLHIDRLDESKHGDGNFYGVKLDPQNRVLGFWVLDADVEDTVGREKSVYVPIEQMRHLLAEDDIDQILGAPWFGAALLTMDDRRNYEYSELTAAEMASCFVAGYRRSRGQQRFGLGNGPTNTGGDGPLTDGYGNPVTRMQPGMLLDLGADGEFQQISHSRPNASAGEFLSYLQRSEAVGAPGVKSSTITGDYRNSSFSSERSADNDIWPEIEDLQDWFSVCFCQPMYAEVIDTAVLMGLFKDVPGFSMIDYLDRREKYLACQWQGPVARSINPKDDATAARLRIQNGTSSPQREANQIGRDWREIAREMKEYIDYHKELGLPDDIWQQGLGIEQTDENVNVTQPAEEGQQPEPTEEELDEQAASNRFRASGFVSMNQAGK
jgi:lambda family phage portal protein